MGVSLASENTGKLPQVSQISKPHRIAFSVTREADSRNSLLVEVEAITDVLVLAKDPDSDALTPEEVVLLPSETRLREETCDGDAGFECVRHTTYNASPANLTTSPPHLSTTSMIFVK